MSGRKEMYHINLVGNGVSQKRKASAQSKSRRSSDTLSAERHKRETRRGRR